MGKKMIFDYIIVGTGPAGAVLAKMLSDNKRTSVLVLEAGGYHDRDIPIRDSTFAPELEESFSPQYFWQGVGIPQEGLDDRTFEWTTGRLAGGGTSINGEQYTTDCRRDEELGKIAGVVMVTSKSYTTI